MYGNIISSVLAEPKREAGMPLLFREPRYNDEPRDWQNDIVILGYCYKRIPI